MPTSVSPVERAEDRVPGALGQPRLEARQRQVLLLHVAGDEGLGRVEQRRQAQGPEARWRRKRTACECS